MLFQRHVNGLRNRRSVVSISEWPRAAKKSCMTETADGGSTTDTIPVGLTESRSWREGMFTFGIEKKFPHAKMGRLVDTELTEFCWSNRLVG